MLILFHFINIILRIFFFFCMIPMESLSYLELKKGKNYVSPQDLSVDMVYFYRTGNLYDMVIHSKDRQQFKVHAAIVTAASKPLRRILQKYYDAKYILHAQFELNGKIIKKMLDFIYTGNCELTLESIEEILPTVFKWKVHNLILKCTQLLIKCMTPENSIGIYKLGYQYFTHEQKKEAWKFILNNFEKLYTRSSEFLHLDVRFFKCLLSNDFLNVASEENVVGAIVRWVNHDPQERQHSVADLLPCIRFAYISEDYFEQTFCSLPIITNDCYQILSKGKSVIQKAKPKFISAVCNVADYQPRIPNDILFIIHGWSECSPTNMIETFDIRAKRWYSFGQSGTPRAYHGCAVVDNLIYVIGGFHEEEIFRTVKCFDPESKVWCDKANMFCLRCYPSVCVIDKDIYVMGGYNGFNRLKSVEKYSTIKNEWAFVKAMHKARSDAGATVANEKIYVIGGVNDSLVQNTVEEYNPKTDVWTEIVSMTTPRSGVSLVTIKNCIYALGGFNGNSRLQTCEMLDVRNCLLWRNFPDMNIRKSNFGAVVINEVIYTIGGFNGKATINYVEYFNEEHDKWEFAPPIKMRRSALQAVVCTGLSNPTEYTAHGALGKNKPEDQRGGGDSSGVALK